MGTASKHTIKVKANNNAIMPRLQRVQLTISLFISSSRFFRMKKTMINGFNATDVEQYSRRAINIRDTPLVICQVAERSLNWPQTFAIFN